MESKPNLKGYSIDTVVWLAYDERKKKFSGITMDQVLEEVCLIFEESPVMVKSKSRERKYLFCRYIIAYVIYSLMNATLKDVANYLGGKDHTTIVASNEKVRTWIRLKDPAFYEYWLKYTEGSQIWNRYSNHAPFL